MSRVRQEYLAFIRGYFEDIKQSCNENEILSNKLLNT